MTVMVTSGTAAAELDLALEAVRVAQETLPVLGADPKLVTARITVHVPTEAAVNAAAERWGETARWIPEGQYMVRVDYSPNTDVTVVFIPPPPQVRPVPSWAGAAA